MLIDSYNQKGEKLRRIRLPQEIFEIEMNSDLVHQVMVSQMANRRQVIAHTKTRAEVSGGGRKPWRQKGTGRARHGSIRSPIWIGGGVAFGPRKDRVFKKKIPKKMRRKALFMVLSSKVKDKELLVLDKLETKEPQTKIMAKMMENLRKKIKDFKEGSVLFLLAKKDENLIKSLRNIKKVKTLLEIRTMK
ncbi:unnamed protein product [marine sediment metagenome]|uniref:50S ribosomal protein L4 n=1 Tax=marine sediment metagenome TaxID=412755 RepID=X1F5K2_9ZZZZ